MRESIIRRRGDSWNLAAFSDSDFRWDDQGLHWLWHAAHDHRESEVRYLVAAWQCSSPTGCGMLRTIIENQKYTTLLLLGNVDRLEEAGLFRVRRDRPEALKKLVSSGAMFIALKKLVSSGFAMFIALKKLVSSGFQMQSNPSRDFINTPKSWKNIENSNNERGSPTPLRVIFSTLHLQVRQPHPHQVSFASAVRHLSRMATSC